MKKAWQYFMALGLLMGTLAGCSANSASTQPTTSVTVDEPTETQENQTGDSGSTKQEDASGEVAVDGGKPWVDSDLKKNITADMQLSEKDDFHLFVNHGWLMETDIPDGYRSTGSFLEVNQIVSKKAKDLLEKEGLDSHNAKLVQGLYHAFLDWETRDALGMDPIMPQVSKIQAIGSLKELSEFLCNEDNVISGPVFIECGNMPSLDDALSYITAIDHDEFLLDDAAEYAERTELGDRYYNAYKSLASKFLSKIGYSKEEAEAMFDDVIAFEAQLAEVSLTSNDKMDPDIYQKINNVMTMEELSSLAPDVPVKDILDAYGYSNSNRFLIFEPEYFKRFNELYLEENVENIKKYMLIHYLILRGNELDREAFDACLQASNEVGGSSGAYEDEQYAYETVRGVLTQPMDRLYLEEYDASKKKQDIISICERVIETYRKQLAQTEWLSEETRERAIEKLDNIRINAVYPDKWYDYSNLSLDGLSYKEMIEKIEKFNRERDKSRTNQNVDPEEWDLDILETNAYYNPSDNSINIILGLLDGVFYQDDMSKEELYGGIGSVIGHEISHAFDTNGAQFDKNGNLSNWWAEEDFAAFRERANKLAAYYDQIIAFEGYNVLGKNVQTEAIADMAGMKCMIAIAKEEENFDYDKFFRQYATIWKRLNSREFEYSSLTQDTHPLHYLRTNVTLQQFDEFLNEYDIQSGDNMYLAPEDRILVW